MKLYKSKDGNEYIRIRSVEGLKRYAKIGKIAYCFISLAGGACRSSKDIERLSKDKWCIFHSIDSVFEDVTSKQLLDQRRSNIPIAMKRGCFWMEKQGGK